jgi:hypothetical protein
MSDTTKRLDLQFGSFACSVQGFDDPVQPVQQVLQALQNLLEETPELGDAGISFDAEAIERLIGEVARRADIDERDVEIVPGLIIVHRRDGEAAEYPDTDDDVFDDTSFDRADGRADGDEASIGAVGIDAVGEADSGPPVESAEPDDAEPGYVNIFAPRRNSDGEAAAKTGLGLFQIAADHTTDPIEDAEEGDETDSPDDPFASRLGALTTPEAEDSAEDFNKDSQKNDPAADIFADSGGEAGAGDSVFADPVAVTRGAETGDDGPSINFVSSRGGADRDGDDVSPELTDNPVNLFASAAPGDAADQQDEDSDRGEVLFGRTEDQPEIEAADEGYTAAGLAKTAGAESVSELIVSAAAWMVLIQGQTTFTRSEVVAVFEAMPGDHVKTLEARIKGFGKAVRNGQLVLVEEGVFGLSRTELERFQRLL